jgi:MFS family permease
VGLRSDRGPILLALMVSTGLIAMDATILATAVPSVVRDLGGFSQFPWLFSVYLLAQAVSVPIYAKLADILGRKPLMLFGIGLFLAGSVLCGFAWSMTSLIIFRAIQGLGAGAVQPMAITIAGDIYTVAERAKAQGYIASVWAVSSVVGPTLGGIFSQLGIWRWIFFVNVPLCLVAGTLIARNFHERVERQQHRIDYAGAGLLTVAMSLLILGILEGGQAWSWSSPTSIGVLTAGTLLLLAFLLVERRAAEPVLPLWVLSRRLLATTTMLALGVGVILIGLTSFVPTYLENLPRHRPPRRRSRAGRPHHRLADLGHPVGTPALPALRVPAGDPRGHGARRPRHRVARAAGPAPLRRGRGAVLLRDRPRPRPGCQPVAHRGAGQRRVARTWRRHGHEHVRAVDRQRGRRSRARRRRERCHRPLRTPRDRPGHRCRRGHGGLRRRAGGRARDDRRRTPDAQGHRRRLRSQLRHPPDPATCCHPAVTRPLIQAVRDGQVARSAGAPRLVAIQPSRDP